MSEREEDEILLEDADNDLVDESKTLRLTSQPSTVTVGMCSLSHACVALSHACVALSHLPVPMLVLACLACCAVSAE